MTGAANVWCLRTNVSSITEFHIEFTRGRWMLRFLLLISDSIKYCVHKVSADAEGSYDSLCELLAD